MTPRLLLNSTKPKDYTRNARKEMRGVWCVCVSYSPPPIFIAGSHGVKLAEQLLASNEEVTRGLDEAVGPMGQVGRPVGRSACQVGQPPSFVQQAVLGLLVLT